MIKTEDFIKEYERRAKHYFDMVRKELTEDDVYTEDEEYAKGMASIYRLVAKELKENKFYVVY